MRRSGTLSWYYSLFFGGGLILSRDGDARKHRHVLWAYLNSDRFLGINDEALAAMKASTQAVRRYEAIGSVFSQLVREAAEGFDRESYAQRVFGRSARGASIVSFFDTTFIDSPDCPTTYEDALGFYADILRFLEDRGDALVVVKPSKDAAYFTDPARQWASPEKGRRLIALWERIKAHSRARWAGDAGGTVEIMAASDLVITHCFSSPTIEALGARRRALWYEPGEKFRGTYYDRIPGLVAHGYQELSDRSRELTAASEEEHGRWLDRHVKGALEAHLDGLALTRLRRALGGA